MMSEIVSEYHLWLLLLMQGTACIALGLAGSQILKHHAARAHQVLLIALLASVLMPAAYLGVRHFELGLLTAPVPAEITLEPEMPAVPQPVAAVAVAEEVETQVQTDADRRAEATLLPAPSVANATSAELPWRAILLTCWAAAALALTARLAFRFVLGVALLRNARSVDAMFLRRALAEACQRMGVTGPVDLRVNRKVCSPVIWCWSRTPTLLVQTDALENMRRHDWVSVFCHELAHLKRRDHATGLLAELLICLVPWHPLLWWARKRLLQFSEEACDDWVLADGRNGVDYAESLLELSPQPELAFVPTVVGKEKTMKARIRRIVEEKCGVPHIGRRWATVVTILVLGLTIGVAFAQRRPAERPRPERAEQRELMMAGRRNVLSRLLEQLVDQTREIEEALRRRGDDPGPDGTVMRAELETLHEQIRNIERQLGNLNRRDQPRPESDAPRPRVEQLPEIEVRTRQLDRQQDELAEQAGRLEAELRELQEGPSEPRQRVEQELQRVHRRIEAIGRERADLERERRAAEERARRREQVTSDARRMAREPREMSPERPEAAREPEREARQYIEQQEGTRAREARELNQHLRELQRHARDTERNLERIDDKDSIEAQDLRAGLDATHEEMAQIEQVLSRLRTAAARAEAGARTARAEAGARAARAEARSRRRPEEGPNQEERLRQAREGLMAQIRMTEEKLKVAREQESPAAERLQRVLEQLHERRENLEREAAAPNDAQRERPSRNPDVERQVEELRGKVDGMHEEMAQMREMLQQLLERRRPEN